MTLEEKKNTCESYEPWKLSHSKTRFNKRLENNDPSAWFLSAYQKTFSTVQPKQKPEAELHEAHRLSEEQYYIGSSQK